MGEVKMNTSNCLTDKVNYLASQFSLIPSQRDDRLFTDFLVDGYKMTTLRGTSYALMDNVLYAKVCLGMIITLYDDLADNPNYYNPKLLKYLYQLNLKATPLMPSELTSEEINIYGLALLLISELEKTLSDFPLYSTLENILIFDINQIYLANQYAELMTAHPEIRNLSEARRFGPYNMGMVAAGMIDLMASQISKLNELGQIRELLILGQRLGRIGNVINTYEREKREGDLTNELMLYPDGVESSTRALLKELEFGLNRLDDLEKRVSMNGYAQGVSDLFGLHSMMRGII